MNRSQQGVTLIELMIAAVIGLIALASILTVYAATTRQNHLQLETMHLHQQVHGMLHLMSRDIRRSGFWSFDAELQAADSNPFQQNPNQLQVGAHPAEPGNSCLLLAYDLDRDGLVGVGKCTRGGCGANTDADNVEQFGYRLHNGRLQSRYGGKQYTCDRGFWQTINDPTIEVTRLEFTHNTHCINLADTAQPCDAQSTNLTQHAVQIDIQAQLAGKPGSGIAFSQWVRVRNDQLEARHP